MSEYLQATPDESEHYCPACEPSRDPFAGIVVQRYCWQHELSVAGLDDKLTGESRNLSGTSDPDGADCRAIAKLLRKRGIRT